jgi:hypothetical protein
MPDYPKGHVVVPVTIDGVTKKMCLSCGNGDLGKDGKLPAKVTPEMAGKMLRHRLEHGKCKDCWPEKKS